MRQGESQHVRLLGKNDAATSVVAAELTCLAGVAPMRIGLQIVGDAMPPNSSSAIPRPKESATRDPAGRAAATAQCNSLRCPSNAPDAMMPMPFARPVVSIVMVWPMHAQPRPVIVGVLTAPSEATP